MDQILAPAYLPFDEDDLEVDFDEGDLARGRAYQRQGMVKKLAVAPGGRRIEGEVSGSQRRPYSVTVTLEKHTRHEWSIDSECTCPVEYLCKHAAALLFQALEDGKRFPIVPAGTGSDPAIDLWLDDLARLDGSAETRSRSPQALCYVLKPPKRGARGGRIMVVVTKPQKQGGHAYVRDLQPHEMRNNNVLYITPEDRLIERLRTEGAWYSSAETISEDGETVDLTLRKIVATGRAFLGSLEGPNLCQGPPRQGRLGWYMHKDGKQSPVIAVQDNDPERFMVLAFAWPWYFDRVSGEAGSLMLDAPPALVRRFLDGPAIEPLAIEATADRLNAAGMADLIEPPRRIVVEHLKNVEPTACLRLVRRADAGGWESRPMGLFHFDYDGVAAERGATDPADSVRTIRTGTILIIERKPERENILAAQLKDIPGLFGTSHHMPGVPPQRAAFHFQGADSRTEWLDFLHRHLPMLRDEGWRVDIDASFDEQFRFAAVDDAPLEADFRQEEGSGWWFSLDLGILIDGERVPLLPLLIQGIERLNPARGAGDAKRIIEDISKQGFLYADLPDGRVAPLPFDRIGEILATLVELFDNVPLNPDGTLSVPIDLATALSRIETATRMRWLGGERLRALMEKLASFSSIAPVPAPEGLRASLRPYQEQGVAWLQFLREYGLGGILADDMGLGKTIQTLTSLLVEKQAGRLDRPCLVICPTSLVPNWQDETARFAPQLKVLSLHGPDRADRFAEIASADLVLSTYPLLARDSEQLLPVEWHMVVLDEAQAIKNPTARSTQLACQLNARHRLCLTGTPVENHLGEAWSHFAFLMPGLLGDAKRFNRLFRHPIEKHGDRGRQEILAKRLKPFILRRTKGQVLTELPPKTEIVRHVELGGVQRDFYETLRLAMHEKVREAVSAKGFDRSRIVILDALLKLRQACCDPRLVRLQKTRQGLPSAKLEALLDMLPEMIEEGRRILLFSQFTSMLDLIKPKLEALGIPFVEIRGETKDRRTPVRQFEEGKVPLFLISLKAGGTGLNLTAADTVIHYDPWWNPAVETQATDRAHRIGQQKNVFVYKLIARDTIEDRILALQDRKRAIGAAILGGDGDAATPLSRDDLDFLFRGEM